GSFSSIYRLVTWRAAMSSPAGDWSLERYRAYLQFLARQRLGGWPHCKLSASDVVQETLLKAHQHRDQFRGQTEAEWRGWLRRILANTVAEAARKLPEERAIGRALEESSSQLEAWLSEQTSPSAHVQRDEPLLRVAEALAQLPEDERTALELRYLQTPRWSLAEIAKELQRPSAKAVAGLLSRGLEKLRRLLGPEQIGRRRKTCS